MSSDKSILDMKCHNCGASLSLDLDNLQKFCPYCGDKILVDPVAFKEVLIEKEKTKRVGMKYEQEQREWEAEEARRPGRNKLMIILAVIGAFMMIGGQLIANGNTNSPWYLISIWGAFPLLADVYIWLSTLKPKK